MLNIFVCSKMITCHVTSQPTRARIRSPEFSLSVSQLLRPLRESTSKWPRFCSVCFLSFPSLPSLSRQPSVSSLNQANICITYDEGEV
uniref:Uncharacterized protein n=1 Tax=Takifugu rubripes TaxID=31033 RepID=A0A674N372_TAKRU